MHGLLGFSAVVMGALSVGGCAGLDTATSENPLAPAQVEVQRAAAQPEGAVAALGGGPTYGVDDVGNWCGASEAITPGGSGAVDEINTPSDVDCYVWPSPNTQRTYRIRAVPGATAVGCRLNHRLADGSWSAPVAWDMDGGACDFTYTSNIARDYCVKVVGHQGSAGPAPVYVSVQ